MDSRPIPAVDEKAPAFSLPDQNDTVISLDDYKGRWIVLYFYPKDNTSGCTKEACDFSEMFPRFTGMNAVILGVSPDSTKSHRNFIAKQNLSVTLLSDPERQVIKLYGALGVKKMYGKESIGVIRSTFLIDPEGIIRHVWPKVSVMGHAAEVRETLEQLQK